MANQCYVPLELETAVNAILPLVARFKQHHAEGHALQVRFGLVDSDGAWKHGVSASFFSATLQLLRHFKGWSSVEEPQYMHTYVYSAGDARVCTTLHIGTPCSVTHVKRSTVGQRMIKLSEASFQLRLSLKTEDEVDAASLPVIVTPEFVKLCERTTFSLEHWRFHFSRTWSGRSRSEAEQRHMNDETQYEIEVEFCGTKAYLMTLTDEYMATSALMKACSVLGKGVVRMEPVSVR